MNNKGNRTTPAPDDIASILAGMLHEAAQRFALTSSPAVQSMGNNFAASAMAIGEWSANGRTIPLIEDEH